MRRQFIAASLTLIFFVSLFALAAHAAVVGRFTQVIGQVDLLKAGKLPALAAKVQDGVEPADIIRTKVKAKAQLTMVDDSIITLAPESRLAIADYQYDPARGERRAVVRLFRGLVHTVVNRIIKTEEPDFIMETHTATIGVRGTDWHTFVVPNSTFAALGHGTLSINISGLPAMVLLHSRQFIQVPKPFLPQALTLEIIRMLEGWMDTGLPDGGLGFGLPTLGSGPQFQSPLTLPVNPDQRIRQETIPPTLRPTPQYHEY